MFEFLQYGETVGLIHDFMHRWHKIDDQQELYQLRRRREHWDKQKQNVEAAAAAETERRSPKKVQEKELKADSAAPAQPVQPPTVAQISEGTGRSHDEILQAIKANADQFVHWPGDEPRYALVKHVELLGLQDYHPVVGE